MSDDLQAQLLEAFGEECREHLAGLRAVLADAERGQADVEEAFRRAHSLKAAARVCNLGTLAALGQRLEALLAAVRKGTPRLDAAADVIRQVVEEIENWNRAREAGESLPDFAPAVARIDGLLRTAPAVFPPGEDLDAALLAAFQVEHREHLEGIRALLPEIGATGTAASIDEAFRRAHSLKGAARLAGLRPAETVAHRLETLFAQVREGSLRLTPVTIQAIQRGLNFIEDAAICLAQRRPTPDPTTELAAIDTALKRPADAAPTPQQAPDPTVPHATMRTVPSDEAVRISADHLDRLLQTVEQVLTEGLSQDQSLREVSQLRREADELLREWESAASTMGLLQQRPGSAELARLNRLLHDIGERVRGLARRARRTHRRQRQGSWALHTLGRQLQHEVRQARTVPAEGIFQGFRKMMRDLARAAAKELDFHMTGLDVKADRLVLQALKDPLMHVLRNAVSHGIEPPDERQRRGKGPTGQVALSLEVAGSNLRLVVEDDGRGIDAHALAEEAVRRGLLTEDAAARADPEELTRLVFRPGFTTARVVTDLAGRGMGLSVVQEAVTRLQGEVQLAARAVGTRVAIVVPLSVSAQRLLLVSSRGQNFALPAHGVERLLRIRRQEIEVVGGVPMVSVDGEPVPVRALADLLGLAGEEEPGDLLPVVIVRSGPRRLAVMVGSLLGEREALLKELAPPANRGDRWAGGILLEDASVCLVINPGALFRTDRPAAPMPAVVPKPRAAEKRQPTILVVDDSLTTRTLERSILEAHGYRVRVALDGLEALTQLRSDLPDLVITDIQMPRLDGFGLLEQMKKDPHLARLPVIVVTSMEKREDQERGLALGADAYVVKRKFDHEELLQTVRQIL